MGEVPISSISDDNILDFRAWWKRQAVPRPFLVIVALQLFCTIWILIRSFAPAPFGALTNECPCRGIDRCICARPTVEALTLFEMFCLANSRVAAYITYPLFLCLFLTMCRNLKSWLQYTIVVEFVPIASLHNLHVWAGTFVGISTMWHGLWHLIRWGVQTNLSFLLEHPTGISGMICLVITPMLVWPMRLHKIRQNVSFEIRKRMHYFSWVWMASLMAHAPATNIVWITGSAFTIYLLDWFYGVFWNTRLAPSARFVRLESAVMILVPKPDGWNFRYSGGFCYLCVPWISKVEWHAFSVFEDPVDESSICFCIAVAGDWTAKLHNAVREPINRRLWIYGPFPSPFASAAKTDSVISIASGIGITPALSVIKSLAESRMMHLIWIVRDASLLEFMIDYGMAFDDDAFALIFYTGKRELVFQRKIPYNVYLLKGRPDLDHVIMSIIRASRNKSNLDLSKYEILHEYVEQHMEEAPLLEHRFYREISRLLLTYSVEELFSAAVRRSHLANRRVCFVGLRELIDNIFVSKFSDEQLQVVFEAADEDCTGTISFTEFQNFIERLQQNTQAHNSEYNKESKPVRSELMVSVGGGESMHLGVTQIEHWKLMYCGGSARVVEQLQAFSKLHHVSLSVESFEW